MKRALWFLILILVLLNACSAKKSTVQVTPAMAQPTATAPALESTAVSQAVPVTGNQKPTAVTENIINPTLAPTQAAASPEAVIGVDGLNLRYGPGLNYRVSRVLTQGQAVRLEGRSQDGEWIVARLPDGTAGWVFGAYLQTDANLAALPMLEAAGGPAGSPVIGSGSQEPQPQPTIAPLPRKYSLSMSIQDNQAEVSLARFPANSEIIIRLGVRGEGPSMTVATVTTDENGSASLTFEMPVSWPDGSPLTQNELRLKAATADGRFSGGANIVYSAGE